MTYAETQQAMRTDASDQRHGTLNGYANLGCRCAACKAAQADWCDARRHLRVLAADDPRHGRYTTYGNYRCRCAACTAAWATYMRTRKSKSP